LSGIGGRVDGRITCRVGGWRYGGITLVVGTRPRGYHGTSGPVIFTAIHLCSVGDESSRRVHPHIVPSVDRVDPHSTPLTVAQSRVIPGYNAAGFQIRMRRTIKFQIITGIGLIASDAQQRRLCPTNDRLLTRLLILAIHTQSVSHRTRDIRLSAGCLCGILLNRSHTIDAAVHIDSAFNDRLSTRHLAISADDIKQSAAVIGQLTAMHLDVAAHILVLGGVGVIGFAVKTKGAVLYCGVDHRVFARFRCGALDVAISGSGTEDGGTQTTAGGRTVDIAVVIGITSHCGGGAVVVLVAGYIVDGR